MTSASVHAVAIYGTMWVMGPPRPVATAALVGSAPKFETPLQTEIEESEEATLDHYSVGETPVEPPVLTTDTLRQAEPPEVVQEEQINTNADEAFVESGGGLHASLASMFGSTTGLKLAGEGPMVPEHHGGINSPVGQNDEIGSGGKGEGFKNRGKGIRKAMVGGYGGTKASERCVGSALNWFARHQNPDGSWGLEKFNKGCQDGSCAGGGTIVSNQAATAMALLPFLSGGQTHKAKGPYQKVIKGGLLYLVSNQQLDGDLRGPNGTMYIHGIATLALCEAYGMTGDRALGERAQRAVQFIENAQDPSGGGWRYAPGDPGDLSVFGWQLMALKSAKMAGLAVSPQVIARGDGFLRSCSSGKGGLFGYQPGQPPSPAMGAVGLLCTQYLGARRDSPAVQEGFQEILKNLPDGSFHSLYYWYYATMAMHNLPGPEWDMWNRRMRKVLIDGQVRYGCASGSWSAQGHQHCETGGRLMATALSTLSLEVYYRYMPLYRAVDQ